METKKKWKERDNDTLIDLHKKVYITRNYIRKQVIFIIF